MPSRKPGLAGATVKNFRQRYDDLEKSRAALLCWPGSNATRRRRGRIRLRCRYGAMVVPGRSSQGAKAGTRR